MIAKGDQPSVEISVQMISRVKIYGTDGIRNINSGNFPDTMGVSTRNELWIGEAHIKDVQHPPAQPMNLACQVHEWLGIIKESLSSQWWNLGIWIYRVPMVPDHMEVRLRDVIRLGEEIKPHYIKNIQYLPPQLTSLIQQDHLHMWLGVDEERKSLLSVMSCKQFRTAW